jgi:hypothetical protein
MLAPEIVLDGSEPNALQQGDPPFGQAAQRRLTGAHFGLDT